MNRIEGDCAQLGELLGVTLTTKTWVRTDFATVAELARIRENISALRAAYYTPSSTPDTPDNPLNNWEKFNAAEQILADLYSIYNKNCSAYMRLGEGYAGDQIGVI